MEKKRYLPVTGLSACLIFFVVSVFTINFCTFPRNADAADSKKVIFMSLPQGGKIYATNVTLTQLVNKYSDLECSISPVPSPIAEVALTNKGEGDVVIYAYDGMYSAYKGWEGNPGFTEGFRAFKDKPNLNMRILMGADYNFWTMFTTPQTGIKTMPDLKGKKISGHVRGWLISNYARAMLMAYGLDPDKDLKVMTFARTSIGSKALLDGLVDAALDVPNGPAPMEVSVKKGMWMLPIEPSKIDWVKKVSPVANIVESPSYINAMIENGPVPIIGVKNNLMANKKLSDYAAYTIVKIILEHNDELVRADKRFKEFSSKGAVISDFMIPYHPGAIQYYKEKGMWSAALDSQQARMLAENEKMVKSTK